MSKDMDKLAAEMQKLKPSNTSRARGMDAAMAAFDKAFAGETVTALEASNKEATQAQKSAAVEKKPTPDQGIAIEPRPTSQSTRTTHVRTFGIKGRDMMASFNNVFTAKRLMMGGSCMAALIASLIVFQTNPFDIDTPPPTKPIVVDGGTTSVDPVIPAAPIAPEDTKLDAIPEVLDKKDEAKPPVKVTSPTVKSPDIKPLTTKPSVPKSLSAEPTDTNPSTAAVEPPVVKIPATPALPEDTVVIERRVLKTPAITQERVVPAVTKSVSRRVIKTPARTEQRILPAITKDIKRRVKDGDTYKIVTETVVVKPQSVDYLTHPATYETVTETVVVQEASTELVSIPAVYETVRETVKIGADGATQVIASKTIPSSFSSPTASAGKGGINSISHLLDIVGSDRGKREVKNKMREAAFRAKRAALSPGYSDSSVAISFADVGSLGASAPAISASTSSGVVAPTISSPSVSASTVSTDSEAPRKDGTYVIERSIPAITKQVSRRVVKRPASAQERVIPAVTKDVTVRVKAADGTFKNVTKTFVIQEARTEYVNLPAVYETVSETVVASEAYTEIIVMNADGSIASRSIKVMPIKPIPPKPTPQAGRLTAGDYDDVLNPGLYKIYLDKMLQGQLKGKDLPYVDANQRIGIRVVDRRGKPVPLANISLKTAKGEKMFPLRTGGDGMAYLYPSFDGLKPGVQLEISIKGARSVKKILSKNLIDSGGDIVVDLNTRSQPIKSLDLLLTIDATGSMGDEMRYLQSELKAIVGRVEEANPGIGIRTGLVVYRDKGDAYVVREIPFTDDLESFRRSLAKQNAAGGGDAPEAMHTAMQTGLEMEWRKDALKVNLLVADAPPHNQNIADTWAAALMSRTKGIHVVPLAASGVDKTAEFLMRSMAQMTGGRYLFLTDDSGIGNPHAKPTVDCYVVTRLDGLVTRVLSSLIKGERVEPEAGEVIRSVGNYRSGTCKIEPVHLANTSPQKASHKDEQ